MTRTKCVLGFGAAALFMSAAPMVLAQTTPPPAAPAPGGEITVTALRTATNIQKTPVAVTAFNTKALQNQNVQTLQDVTRIAPAVRFVGEGNVDAGVIQMRGLGSPPAGSGGPAVQLYENEFNVFGFGDGVATYDIANIQVLKGPQGTLFGRNTLGGAILYDTVQPSYSQNGYLQATYGNHNYWDLEGAGNVTILPDVLALRVAGQIRRRDGWATSIANQFSGPPQNYTSTLGKLANVSTESFRTSLLFTPTPKFKNTFMFEYFHGNETGQPTFLINPQNFVGAGGLSQAEANALIACNHLCVDFGNYNSEYFRREFYTVINTTTYEITPDISVKNIAGWAQHRADIAIDSDGGPRQFLLVNGGFSPNTYNPQTYYSEELQLRGNSFNRFHWLIGGYYQYRSNDPGPSGLTLALTPGLTSVSSSGGHSDTKAVFFNVDTDLTQRLKLHTGFRYTWDTQTVCAIGAKASPTVQTATQPLTSNEVCALAAIGGLGAGVLNQKAAAPTWTVGLDWQATDNMFLYVTSRRGYRSGGVNTPVFNTPCTTGQAGAGTVDTFAASNGNPALGPVHCLDFGFVTTGVHNNTSLNATPFQFIQPEYLTDVEIGMRSTWMMGDWRTRFNLQYFHYWYSNVSTLLQLGAPASPPFPVLTKGDPGAPGLGSVAFNGGVIIADGVEGDLTVNPTRDLTLDYNFSYFSQRQTKSPTPPAGFSPAFFPPVNLPTPKFAMTASVNYVLPWHPLNGDLVLVYNYFLTSSFLAQSITVPGYDLHNARVEWNNIGRSPISAAFWMNNIADRRYELSPVNLVAGEANYGEPRMFGFDLNVKFH